MIRLKNAAEIERIREASVILSDALAELRRMADAGKLDPDCVAALDTHPAEIADILAHCQDQAPHA